jgi:hypothetical protein
VADITGIGIMDVMSLLFLIEGIVKNILTKKQLRLRNFIIKE